MFKYLEDSNAGMNAKSAAQSWLDKNQSKNKYASVSDPNNPYSMGAGVVPTAEAYDDQRVVTNQAEIDAAKAKNESSGGTGAMTAEEVRKKFGLSFNEEHSKMDAPGAYSRSSGGDGFAHDNGAIFTKSGEYVGSVKADEEDEYYEEKFKDLTDAASPYKEKAEGKGFSSVDSLSDVAGAVRFLTDGDGGADVPEPVYEQKPIEHSAEITQAKERVQNWERSVEDGSMSDSIFNNDSMDSFDPSDYSVPQKAHGQGQAMAEDKYNFDATKGKDGIGVQQLSTGAKGSTDAAAAFVDNQVADIKKKYNFQPAS